MHNQNKFCQREVLGLSQNVEDAWHPRAVVFKSKNLGTFSFPLRFGSEECVCWAFPCLHLLWLSSINFCFSPCISVHFIYNLPNLFLVLHLNFQRHVQTPYCITLKDIQNLILSVSSIHSIFISSETENHYIVGAYLCPFQ